MVSVASQFIEEVTAHAQINSLEDARETCADGTYFPNNIRALFKFLATQRDGLCHIHSVPVPVKMQIVCNSCMGEKRMSECPFTRKTRPNSNPQMFQLSF